MIEKLPESSGSAVGFEVSGTVTAQDYEVLVPAVAAVAEEYGNVQLLCDMAKFHGEDPAAWISDLKFGHQFHDKITKFALVGDGRIGAVLARLSVPLYAKEARHFEDRAAAWDWLRA